MFKTATTATAATTTTTLLVFDSELARALASPAPAPSTASTPSPSPSSLQGGGRFGTVYVGCRRVRPSSRLVQRAYKLQKKQQQRGRQQQPQGNGSDNSNKPIEKEEDDAVEDEEDEAAADADERSKKGRKKRRRRNDEPPAVKDDEEDGEGPRAAAGLSSSADDDGGGAHDDLVTSDAKPAAEEGILEEEGGGDQGGGDDDLEVDLEVDPEGVDPDEDEDDDGGYYRFPNADRLLLLSNAQLKEEIADLSGEREGVPPVALPYSMMRLLGFNSDESAPTSRFRAVLDEDLSRRWADTLKGSMGLAEALRDQDESIRKMPYVLEPEAWVRQRPETLLTKTATTTAAESAGSDTTEPTDPTQDAASATCDGSTPSDAAAASTRSSQSWFGCRYDTSEPSQRGREDETMVRRQQQQQQQQRRRQACDAAAVQLLHTNTSLHVSCGAKFGCDYLLYKGARNEHHAFAGLRVMVPSSPLHECNGDDRILESLPLPTPYDMAGYVRGLNTAGKLALLATAVLDDDPPSSNPEGVHVDDDECRVPAYRVAVVDLALKKVRATTFRGASGTVTPKWLPKKRASG